MKEKVETLYALKAEYVKMPEIRTFGLYYITQKDEGIYSVVSTFRSYDSKMLGSIVGSNMGLMEELFSTRNISFHKPANFPDITMEGPYITKFSEMSKQEQEDMITEIQKELTGE